MSDREILLAGIVRDGSSSPPKECATRFFAAHASHFALLSELGMTAADLAEVLSALGFDVSPLSVPRMRMKARPFVSKQLMKRMRLDSETEAYEKALSVIEGNAWTFPSSYSGSRIEHQSGGRRANPSPVLPVSVRGPSEAAAETAMASGKSPRREDLEALCQIPAIVEFILASPGLDTTFDGYLKRAVFALDRTSDIGAFRYLQRNPVTRGFVTALANGASSYEEALAETGASGGADVSGDTTAAVNLEEKRV